MRREVIGGLALSGATRHVHIGQGVVLDLRPVVVQTESERQLQTIGEQHVGLVVETKVELRCAVV